MKVQIYGRVHMFSIQARLEARPNQNWNFVEGISALSANEDEAQWY